MNRNIITKVDAQRLTPEEVEYAGDLAAITPVGAGVAQKADSYFDCLSKYVPAEIIGAYLLIEGLLKTLLKGESVAWGLLILFLVGVISAWLFAQRVLRVVRWSQLAMTAFAFFVWVFATGGWFATLTFWAPGWGTIAVIVFAVMVKIANMGPLPAGSGT